MTSFLVAPGKAFARHAEYFAPLPLRRRLLELPLFDVHECATQFLAELQEYNLARLKTHEQLAALEVFRATVEPLLGRLEIQLAGAVPPLIGEARRTARLVARMLKELAAAHARPILMRPSVWSRLSAKAELYGVLVRSLDYNARRIVLANRFYARAPRGVWAQMHELYGTAYAWKLAARELNSPRLSAQSIYRKALLLEFAEPSRLNAADVRRVADYVAKFGDAARLVMHQPPQKRDGIFVIDPLRDTPGLPLSKRSDAAVLGRSLLLACAPLVRRLARQIQAIEKGTHPLEIGLPADGATVHYRGLLQRLLDNWTGSRRSRSSRTSFRPRVELQAGLEKVWRFLHGGGDLGRGGLKVDRSRRVQDWTILNESASGFALRHVRGIAPSLHIGEVIALRPADRDDIVVAMVRWIHSEHGEEIDIGVQLLAPRLEPVLIGTPGSIDTGYGRALFAAPTAPFNRVPFLVAATRVVRPSRPLVVRSVSQEFAVQPQRVLEATHLVDLLQVAVTG